jgi:hypothetical protein
VLQTLGCNAAKPTRGQVPGIAFQLSAAPDTLSGEGVRIAVIYASQSSEDCMVEFRVFAGTHLAPSDLRTESGAYAGRYAVGPECSGTFIIPLTQLQLGPSPTNGTFNFMVMLVPVDLDGTPLNRDLTSCFQVRVAP